MYRKLDNAQTLITKQKITLVARKRKHHEKRQSICKKKMNKERK
jgi:hypothetical protein